MTPTVRYADIVLPATTFWERNDVHTPWAGAGHYAIYMRQAIEPMYECRNDVDIFDDLSRRVGINGYNDKSETQWLKEFTADAIDDFYRFAAQGVARFPPPKDAVAFARQICDGEAFKTPSGKIEIYSTVLAANPNPYGLGNIPPIPTWIAPNDDLQRFPLSSARQNPERGRIVSMVTNRTWRRVDPDTVWMNLADAAARGIADGQKVRGDNDIGATIFPGPGDRSYRARGGVDQGGGVVCAWPGWTDFARQCQRSDDGSRGAVRGDDLQHEPGGDCVSAGALIASRRRRRLPSAPMFRGTRRAYRNGRR